MMKYLFSLICLIVVVTSFNACTDSDEDPVPGLKLDIIRNYSEIVYANYDDAYTTALALKEKVDLFVANPTELAFENCRNAWKAARIPYGQSEGYRFYGGPIDGEDGPEGYLNAWPIDESFVDYVVGQSTAGLINNPEDYPVISEAVLLELNESISETSIFTGYHAIEFLLWGQDLNAAGPGARPYTDYLTGEGATALNQSRRGTYLKVVTDLLVGQLQDVRDAWAPGAAYRVEFESSANVAVTLGHIFNGIGELAKGELAGERMLVAAESHDQENEHSCFSDNTIADLKLNLQSIKNIYYGIYTRTDGTDEMGKSLDDLALQLDPQKAEAIAQLISDAESKLNLVPAPFDQAIINDTDKINDAAIALSLLSDAIAELALIAEAEI
jgi:putative iron-regulated protein